MKISTGDITAKVHGELHGSPDVIIKSAAPLEKAGEGQLAFLADPALARKALESRAGCLLAADTEKETFKNYPGTVIFVKNPRYAFMLILREAEKTMRPVTPRVIDKTASVHPGAKIGQMSHIGPFCVIEEGAVIGDSAIIEAQSYIGHNVKIGAGTRLHPGVKVLANCEIGERCILHSGVVIGSDGYGYTSPNGIHEKIPQIGKVIIGNDVEIGANTAVDRAALEATIIGDGTKIDNLAHIAHNVKIGRNCLILAMVVIGGSSVIEDSVIISGQSCLADHITIGKGSIIMGKTGVMSNLAPGSVIFGHVGRPRAEAFKLEALYGKLPEIYKELRAIRKRLEPKCPEKP